MRDTSCSRMGLWLGVVGSLWLGHQVAKGDFVFGEPTPVPNLNTPSAEAGPFITADGLELYFTSNRDHGADLCYSDIWVATRTKIGEPWGAPRNLGAPVNTASYTEGYPCVSADGLELYFSDLFNGLAKSCARPGGHGLGDIWVSKRATRETPWGVPVNLGPNINSFEFDGGPRLSADGLSLYFCSARSPGNGFDLYVSTRPTTDAPWGLAVEIGPPINTMGVQDYLVSPFLSADSLSLFFTSVPFDYVSLTAKGDMYVSRRDTATDPWSFPLPLTALNSARQDEGLTFAPGDSTLYFARADPYKTTVTRDPALATYDLWQVEVTPIVDFNGDRRVDLLDLVMLIQDWGSTKSLYDIGPLPLGDGKVDIEDLKVFMTYYEKANPPELKEGK